jgi:heme-degrading monooxygenase HmoA
MGTVISRHWRGLAKPIHAGAYVEHLKAETFPAIRQLPGFLNASILRRTAPEGIEFLIVTEWESLDAVRAFAGDHVEEAVVPAKVHDMMVDYDRQVRHYEVVVT